MAVFDFIYSSSSPAAKPENEQNEAKTPENGETLTSPDATAQVTSNSSATHLSSSTDTSETSPAGNTQGATLKSSPPTSAQPTDIGHHPADEVKRSPPRGFSFRSMAFLSNREEVKPALSTIQEHKKEVKASAAFFRRQTKASGSDKRAKQSALIVRSLIVGPTSPASLKVNKAVSKPQLDKVKSQLMQPKSANKMIAQLRALPASESTAEGKGKSEGPIHAVCLDTTDVESEKRHFSRLTVQDTTEEIAAVSKADFPSVATASMEKLAAMFQEMHIVSLVTAPDFGLGQPGDGEGILSGAIPTAETVIKGFQQITPQLMALGYATGKAVLPDHTGVYPATDRISVLTYWWGLELVLPSASLHNLSSAQSITHTMINFLTALSAMNNGVREILPFVRYIGQYVDFEFSSIQKQDQGQGVVCAATWIMPAAMVPRPWDFSAPPPKPVASTEVQPAEPAASSIDAPRPSQATDTTTRPSESPSDISAPAHSTVPSLPPVLPELVIGSPNGTANPLSV